jgi:DNA methylase
MVGGNRIGATTGAQPLPLFDYVQTDDLQSGSGSILDELTAFKFAGNHTVCERRAGIPFFFNEFWTARQRQGHALHEVSYRACFKPQLPEFFIGRLTSPGHRVYDPFMGRGTTPLQAALMGRQAVGNDINPLSTYLVRPRINPPTVSEISARLGVIRWDCPCELDEELLVFYHPETLREISLLRRYLLEQDAKGKLDNVDDWIRMVAINRLTGHSSGFFSVYSLPPNQAVSAESQRRINEKRCQVPPRRSVPEIILRKSSSLLKEGRLFSGVAEFHTASADHTPGIDSGSIDLVVTSPPFLDVVQYAADNWLRCWFSGIEVQNVRISMHKKAEDWTAFIRSVFTELARVLRPGGNVAFEVGEIRNGKIELERLVLEAIADLPFEPLGVVVNVQEFTKTANCWGVSNNSKGTNTNRIVLAQRT